MILSIVSIIVCVAVLVAFHEIGHLIAAKMSGIGVERFSIGFGPAIFKKKIKETTYVISLIPVGGYVKLVGEDFESEGFYTQPARKKVLVTIFGPVANLVLGFIITVIILLVFGQATLKPAVTVQPGFDADRAGIVTSDLVQAVNNKPVTSYEQLDNILSRSEGKAVLLRLRRQDQTLETSLVVRKDSLGLGPWFKPIIGGISPGGPAYKAGLKPGDVILEIDGKKISTWQDMVEIIQNSSGKTLAIRWRRAQTEKTCTVIPAATPTDGKTVGQIGISAETERARVGFFPALGGAAVRTVDLTVQTFVTLYKVVVGKISRKALGGPILIAQLSAQTIHLGFEYFLGLLVLLSINLCVINLLPIPVLDGGRILIFLIEAVRRKKLTKKEWNIALQAGWVLIFLIFAFVTFNDIVRIVKR
jgi:regulator of sigma E protease